MKVLWTNLVKIFYKGAVLLKYRIYGIQEETIRKLTKWQ